MEKNEIRTFSNTIDKNKLKMDKDLNVRLDILKLEENIGRTLFHIGLSNIVFGSVSQSKGNISKHKQVGPN